jgi:hypothetical protein
MAAKTNKPGQGPIAVFRPGGSNPIESKPGTGLHLTKVPRRFSGTYRPRKRFEGTEGLQVTLRRVKGVTRNGALLVPFRFQVPPINEFARQWHHEWTKYGTLRMGERARPQGTTLKSLPFSTIFLDPPAQDDVSFVIWDGAPEPQKLIDELAWLMEHAVVFRLVIAQPAVWGKDRLVNRLAYLSDMQATQKNGEVGSEYLDLVFDQWKEAEADRRRRRPRDEDKTRKHKLRAGKDDLYEIAKRYYKQPSAWRKIAKANGIKGVSPGSEAELTKWAKKHRKKTLKIPPKDKK